MALPPAQQLGEPVLVGLPHSPDRRLLTSLAVPSLLHGRLLMMQEWPPSPAAAAGSLHWPGRAAHRSVFLSPPAGPATLGGAVSVALGWPGVLLRCFLQVLRCWAPVNPWTLLPQMRPGPHPSGCNRRTTHVGTSHCCPFLPAWWRPQPLKATPSGTRTAARLGAATWSSDSLQPRWATLVSSPEELGHCSWRHSCPRLGLLRHFSTSRCTLSPHSGQF